MSNPLQDYWDAMRRLKERQQAALEAMQDAMPILTRAIQTPSGQGNRVLRIVKSCWNSETKIALDDELSGLDSDLGEAVLALLGARIKLRGDAYPFIEKLLTAAGELNK